MSEVSQVGAAESPGEAGAADDDNGHGKHVAASIAARNNGAGDVGRAHGTTIYAVKVLDVARQDTVVPEVQPGEHPKAAAPENIPAPTAPDTGSQGQAEQLGETGQQRVLGDT